MNFELFGIFRRPADRNHRSLSNYLALLGSDDEGLSGGVDDVGGDDVELVDLQDAGDLAHESFDESEVASGDAGDGVGGLGVVCGVGIERQAELLPVVGEDDGEVFGVQGPVLVGEPDPAVELRVAGELPVEAGHADQDHAQVAAVEEVAELFEAAGLEPVGLVDDQQFGVAVLVEVQVELGVVAGIVDAFDVGAEAVDAEVDLEVQLPGGDRDVRGEHRGAGLE